MLLAMVPASELHEKAIAAVVGYAAFLFVVRRFRRPTPIMSVVLGPALTLAAVIVFHFLPGGFAGGDLGYSMLLGIFVAAGVGGLAAATTPANRPPSSIVGWIYASLWASLVVIGITYLIWYATASPGARLLDSGVTLVEFSAIGLFAGACVALALGFVRLIKTKP